MEKVLRRKERKKGGKKSDELREMFIAGKETI
jgi:hypothetical protein